MARGVPVTWPRCVQYGSHFHHRPTHKWLLPRMTVLPSASLGPREPQSPRAPEPQNPRTPEPQNPKPRARERVNSKRSPRTCTIPECRADSLESWSSTTHRQTADVRNRQLPRKAGAYPANPFALERRGLPEPNKSALPHCLASISRPNASRNTRTSQSRAWPSNTGRKPPVNARIKGARGESCATNRNSEIPPSNEPRDQLARTHPALFRAISLNHRSDPAEILPNSDQGSQPQSIRYPVPSLEYF